MPSVKQWGAIMLATILNAFYRQYLTAMRRRHRWA
jgi:hypothetical protein